MLRQVLEYYFQLGQCREIFSNRQIGCRCQFVELLGVFANFWWAIRHDFRVISQTAQEAFRLLICRMVRNRLWIDLTWDLGWLYINFLDRLSQLKRTFNRYSHLHLSMYLFEIFNVYSVSFVIVAINFLYSHFPQFCLFTRPVNMFTKSLSVTRDLHNLAGAVNLFCLSLWSLTYLLRVFDNVNTAAARYHHNFR